MARIVFLLLLFFSTRFLPMGLGRKIPICEAACGRPEPRKYTRRHLHVDCDIPSRNSHTEAGATRPSIDVTLYTQRIVAVTYAAAVRLTFLYTSCANLRRYAELRAHVLCICIPPNGALLFRACHPSAAENTTGNQENTTHQRRNGLARERSPWMRDLAENMQR